MKDSSLGTNSKVEKVDATKSKVVSTFSTSVTFNIEDNKKEDVKKERRKGKKE